MPAGDQRARRYLARGLLVLLQQRLEARVVRGGLRKPPNRARLPLTSAAAMSIRLSDSAFRANEFLKRWVAAKVLEVIVPMAPHVVTAPAVYLGAYP